MQGSNKGANAPNAGEEHQPDVLAALNAAIDAGQAESASWTPQQHKSRKRYYDRLNLELDRRTARKRAAGLKPGRAVDLSTEWKQARRAAAKHATSPVQDAALPLVTTVARPRERRERHIARSTSSGDSGGDSADPEPSEEGHCDCGCVPAQPRRFCACGCRREITHRRAGTKTFGASCRSRLKRANDRGVCRPLEPRSCQCESGFFYRDPEGDAVCGLCGCWLAKVSAPVSGFHTYDTLVRSNGVYVQRRPNAKRWDDTQAAGRRRGLI